MEELYSGSFVTRLRREIGQRPRLGDQACLQTSLASRIGPHHTWDPRKTVHDTDHGGIFNFDFSKNGTLLGVACERKSVLLFDPFNGQLVASKTNIHTDCVNCVKFLDDRLFATCSDDTTVALWDTRYLKHNVRTFLGHSNWVKNIEFDPSRGLLVTSGFDGCIYTWDINRYSEEESSNRVFFTSGLMRSKLSPDFTKLFISTHEGYIIVINNLDLSTLGEDLKGFKPNMYRLMQRSQTPLRIALMFNHVFEQHTNRVEFISDWPRGNDANIISSLQVHPQGWCILSRNTDSTENAEWTCVHEIQDDKHPKERSAPQWEVETVPPHTSSAYCSSTNTPAFSSQTPTSQHSTSAIRNLSNNSGDQSEGSSSSRPSNQEPVGGSTSEHQNEAGRVETAGSQSSGRLSNNTDRNAGGSGHEQGTRNGDAEDSVTPRPDMFNPGGAEVHDSLIQIRRGARDLAGNFSFSISVHTSSGQLIEFNQSDLESDDDDEVTIQQIIAGNGVDLARSHDVTRPRRATGFQHVRRHIQQANAARSQINERSQQSATAGSQNVGTPQHQSATAGSQNVGTPQHQSATAGSQNEGTSQEQSATAGSRNVDTPQRQPSYAGSQNVGTPQEQPPVAGGLVIDWPQATSSSSGTQEDNIDGNNGRDPESPDNEDTGLEELIAPDQEDTGLAELIATDQDHGVDDDIDDTDFGPPFGSDHEFGPALDDDTDFGPPFGDDFSDDLDDDDDDARVSDEDLDEDTDREVDLNAPLYIDEGRNSPDANLNSLERAQQNIRDFFGDSGNSGSVNSPNSADRASRNNEAGNQFNSAGGVNSIRNAEITIPVNTASSQPRTNTFMFVLQSNTGDRRRRFLNLSYMDSYSERENNQLQQKIHMNKKRLLGYVEECNMGRGFIKELAFSADGRLVSSPFGFGLRIFAFDRYCNELCDCVPTSPVKLYEVKCSLAHVNCVVATKFSPCHNLVVSGCLDGKIAFHQPVF